MALLEMREATFTRGVRTLVAPLTLMLGEGERLAYAGEQDAQAQIVALMAAGLVKPTSGSVFIAAFDPRIQPVQVKRIAGYVPHEAVPHDFPSFTRYIEFRAALWGLSRAESVVRARALLERLDGVHEAFAYPLAGALIAQPRLLVLDRPQIAYARQILEAAGSCAIFSTHISKRDARAFGGVILPV
jgi:ABC-type multidrug transport system ATPase subunit